MKENKRFGKGQKVMSRKLARKEKELRKSFANHATKHNKDFQVSFTAFGKRVWFQFVPEKEQPMSQEHQPNPKGGMIEPAFFAVKTFKNLGNNEKKFDRWFFTFPLKRSSRRLNERLGKWGRWTNVPFVVKKFESGKV